MKLNREEKDALIEMVRTPGWKVAKKFLQEYVDIIQAQVISQPNEESLLSSAYKLKFGTLALYSFFKEIEAVQGEKLDNN